MIAEGFPEDEAVWVETLGPDPAMTALAQVRVPVVKGSPPPIAAPLRPRWSPGFLDRDLPGLVLAGQHHPLHLKLLALHQLHHPVEVLLGLVKGRVRPR